MTVTKLGRPPLEPARRRRNNVTIRLRDQAKAALQVAAQANGRSLSEEIEVRLERSLQTVWGLTRPQVSMAWSGAKPFKRHAPDCPASVSPAVAEPGKAYECVCGVI